MHSESQDVVEGAVSLKTTKKELLRLLTEEREKNTLLGIKLEIEEAKVTGMIRGIEMGRSER